MDARKNFYRALYEAPGRRRLVRAIMRLRAAAARTLPAKQTPFSTESHAELMALCRRRDGQAAQRFSARTGAGWPPCSSA